ncbi:MAG: phosphatidylserine/phosphatidylglycerophosphate/cardiolipin synthase family protein [Thermoleophilia bacterium]|nr:phosphatidylserine/phosphatidylglycerophosphate/cardiolipin synthase family protein [Thermoleophilia bacterium]
MAIAVTTLTDGGQTALQLAEQVAAFLDGARRTLDLALYDVQLDGPEAEPVTRALTAAGERGVRVRVVFNVDHPGPIPVPPPPRHVPDLLETLPVAVKPIPGVPDLMHHKYAVRDGESVLTGSANWTEDSWSRQENVLAQVGSAGVAAAYALDFEQLWRLGTVAGSGDVEPRAISVDGTAVRAWFTPGRGTSLAHRIARTLDRARSRVRICSPVISSGPILGTLAQIATDGRVDVAGLVDAPQVAQVAGQWRENGNANWKLPLLAAALGKGDFSAKPSTPWRPDSAHDFMHAKVTVADGTVFLGSFNLSRSGESNAENVLEIEDPALADSLAAFVDDVRSRYPRADVLTL